MYTAKIIRHRHKRHHYINDDLKSVEEETHFKILFSHPDEMGEFEKWCKQHNGDYVYDKENSCQKGTFPQLEIFKEEICWCDDVLPATRSPLSLSFLNSSLQGRSLYKRGNA